MTDYSHLLELPERENAPDGWVYWIGGDTGAVKIGWSKNPEKRLKQFQPGSPVKLKVLHRVEGTYNDERRWHNKLCEHRLHGEWFERGAALMAAGVEWDNGTRLESDVGIDFAGADIRLLRLYAQASLQLVVSEAIRQHEPDDVRKMKCALSRGELVNRAGELLEIINRLATESDDLRREVKALIKQNYQLTSPRRFALELADKS